MADTRLKTAAETLRRRLHFRMCELGEVQAWADQQIAAMEAPHPWLIDLSVAATAADAREILSGVEGEPDQKQVWAALMREWLALLEAAPDRDSEIGRVLFHLAMDDDVPAPEARADMYSFWDAIDLAKDGSHGVLEEERAKLHQFLKYWSEPAD
jgi:hypothetical protein